MRAGGRKKARWLAEGHPACGPRRGGDPGAEKGLPREEGSGRRKAGEETGGGEGGGRMDRKRDRRTVKEV